MWQYLKMTWMFFWRVALLKEIYFYEISTTGILIGSAIVAAIIRFGLQKTIGIFPLIRLITLRNPIISVAPRTYDGQYTPYSRLPIQNSASQQGVLTGYEPRNLKNVPLPRQQQYPQRMYGSPGAGLTGVAHMTKSSIYTGQQGEKNFAKALSITNASGMMVPPGDPAAILQNVVSFWSVAMPSEKSLHHRDKKYTTDIDAILITGNTMFLVDLKFYKSGNITYQSYDEMLYAIDNTTGNLVGQPRKMSGNMWLATQRFKKHFPRMNIHPVVVFVPTDSGTAYFNNVIWTGGIPAVGIQEALSQIGAATRQQAPNGQFTQHLIPLLQR